MLPSLAYQGSKCFEATARVVTSRLHASFSSSSFLRFCSSSNHHSQSFGTNKGDKQEGSPSKSKVLYVPTSQIFNHHHQLLSRQFKRGVSVYYPLRQENKDNGVEEEATPEPREDAEEEGKKSFPGKGSGREKEKVARHLSKDRTKIIPLESSMRYLKSAAYKETYGDSPVWVLYRRNFPGQFAPTKTRRTCIRGGVLTTGNPCPICRDEYLVVDYRNADLLKQFISPFNGEILGWNKTGVCRKKQEELLIAIEKAKDYGVLTFDVPFREYNYKDYENIYASYK
ncbi:unnamed protein product [Orchesella dallaii]|uniref:Small ribosomal subunit protein mS40 n=1 Tax=Orchesella dallaii TaxID=48710 RepID=A0ABP1S543_9HEXA